MIVYVGVKMEKDCRILVLSTLGELWDLVAEYEEVKLINQGEGKVEVPSWPKNEQ